MNDKTEPNRLPSAEATDERKAELPKSIRPFVSGTVLDLSTATDFYKKRADVATLLEDFVIPLPNFCYELKNNFDAFFFGSLKVFLNGHPAKPVNALADALFLLGRHWAKIDYGKMPFARIPKDGFLIDQWKGADSWSAFLIYDACIGEVWWHNFGADGKIRPWSGDSTPGDFELRIDFSKEASIPPCFAIGVRGEPAAILMEWWMTLHPKNNLPQNVAFLGDFTMKRPFTSGLKLCLIVLLPMIAVATLCFGSTDFVVPPGRQAGPDRVIVGPDHNLWFAELTGEKIGRITTGGTITLFSIPGVQSLAGLASGPDGNIWFVDQFAGNIGHISVSGGSEKKYALPAGSHPQGLTVGSDGTLWFVDQKQDGNFTVGKITTSGAITEYTVGGNAGPFQGFGSLAQIIAGPDGNLWFTNPYIGGFLGTITTAGLITTYTLSDIPYGLVSGPDGNLWASEGIHVAKISTSGSETEYNISSGGTPAITVGADGNIWFGETGALGKITTAGTLTEYSGYTFDFASSMVSGPDGDLWFVVFNKSVIGRASTGGTLLNMYLLNRGSGPNFNTLGPDGAVWFTEQYGNRIGRIDVTGNLTTFPIKSTNSLPEGIVTGPDGNLWFAEGATSKIVKMTTAGAMTEYPLAGAVFPFGITTGPDGNVWFTEQGGGKIGRITTSGAVTEYALPTSNALPYVITPGPDGKLWFTEVLGFKVGKIDPGSGTITEYSITSSGVLPSAITAGPDGNLWFLFMDSTGVNGRIGAMNTSGTLLKSYAVPQTIEPQGIVVAPDKALWLPQFYPNGLARVTTNGVVSQIPLTITNATPNDLVFGSDGKLWVADLWGGAISRLSAISGTGINFSAKHGIAFSGKVASFVDGTPAAKSTDFAATINWGNGSKSAGTVAGKMGGPFSVSGIHTYAKTGTFTVSVTLTDSVDKQTYAAIASKATVN